MQWHKAWNPEKPARRTLIFDAFVVVDPSDELIILWPDVTLNAPEEGILDLVLSQLSYFGRAESWCSARLSQDWEPVENYRWARIDKTTGEVLAETNCIPLNGSGISERREPVRMLAPCPVRWNQWDYTKARPPDPPWNLLAETADLHAERWSDPP